MLILQSFQFWHISESISDDVVMERDYYPCVQSDACHSCILDVCLLLSKEVESKVDQARKYLSCNKSGCS